MKNNCKTSGVENEIPEMLTWGKNNFLNTCNIYEVNFMNILELLVSGAESPLILFVVCLMLSVQMHHLIFNYTIKERSQKSSPPVDTVRAIQTILGRFT